MKKNCIFETIKKSISIIYLKKMQTEYKQTLEMAIANEIEAYEFYNAAMLKSQSENLKITFRELAEEEMKHKKTLEAFINNPNITLRFHNTSPNFKISENTQLPDLKPDMSFSEGIALAMKKEQEAMEMYQKFAELSENIEQKAIFNELAKMELGHKVKLEELYTNTAHNEVW